MECYPEKGACPNLSEESAQPEVLGPGVTVTVLVKMRVVTELVGLAVPLLATVYYAWIKHQRFIVAQLRRHAAATGKLTLAIFATTGGESHQALPEPEMADSLDREFVTVRVLAEARDVKHADVVFVHGIKGAALDKTWTQGRWQPGSVTTRPLHGPHHTLPRPKRRKERISHHTKHETEEWSKCWPRDWLPQDCPNARVIAVDYSTDPHLWKPAWRPTHYRSAMSERAWEMMRKLAALGVGAHSIVWVGHSKGGLYVKQILVNAAESNDPKYRRLADRTRGIQFYSVPHRGSPLASLTLPLIFRQSIELIEVQKDCADVLNLDKKFRELVHSDRLKPHIKSFIETSMTLMSLVYVRVVSLDSGDANMGELYGVPLDHRNICKPSGRNCFLYRELVDLIELSCEDDLKLDRTYSKQNDATKEDAMEDNIIICDLQNFYSQALAETEINF